MLGYRHGFHAGNFADVHKHIALCLALAHLVRKPTPFCFLDSHAGGGPYDLEGEMAAKTREWRQGIGRMMAASPASEGLTLYREAVRGFNPDGRLTLYPGSHSLAAGFARATDRLVLMELHPAEWEGLTRLYRRDRRVHIHRRDAFEGLPALVPPKEQRGVVLVDPTYELKDDYDRVPEALAVALRRWPSGIYIVWYPMLPEGRHRPLPGLLRALVPEDPGALVSELVGPDQKSGQERRMYGSGLMVLNPPFGFAGRFEEAVTEARHILFPA